MSLQQQAAGRTRRETNRENNRDAILEAARVVFA